MKVHFITLLPLLLPLSGGQVYHWGPCPQPEVQPNFELQKVASANCDRSAGTHDTVHTSPSTSLSASHSPPRINHFTGQYTSQSKRPKRYFTTCTQACGVVIGLDLKDKKNFQISSIKQKKSIKLLCKDTRIKCSVPTAESVIVYWSSYYINYYYFLIGWTRASSGPHPTSGYMKRLVKSAAPKCPFWCHPSALR